jgi:head-tail adaptor
MALADEMRDRILLQRYVEGTAAEGHIGHHFVPLDHVWAAVEDQGDGRYRIRLRYREDLRKQDDIEPAMRVIYRGNTLIVDGCAETVHRVETQLSAHREIIEPIEHLQTGTRRIKSWP